MAGRVMKRTSNSVTVEIKWTNNSGWETVTVGGSVIFMWKLIHKRNTDQLDYIIKFCDKIPLDNMKYIVTYTHWKVMDEMDTAVMRIHSNQRAVYCPGSLLISLIGKVNVEIGTYQLSPFATIYDDAELTDFMLRGEDGSVPFHKVVLAAHSSVFKTMLTGEWKETSEGVINFPGTSKEMLQYLKIYMYLGRLPKKQNEQVDYLKQLLLLSSCYLIEDLKLRCIKELRFLTTIENVSDMMQFAMENKIKWLLVEIMDCAATGDIDIIEVRKLVKAEDATPIKSEGA